LEWLIYAADLKRHRNKEHHRTRICSGMGNRNGNIQPCGGPSSAFHHFWTNSNYLSTLLHQGLLN